MNRLIRVLTFVALSAPAVVLAADDDLAVVVNKANSASNLTKSQLRKLVLGEQGSWPDGKKVAIILRPPGNPEREGVLRSICRMSEDDYIQHAMHASFSGEAGSPPKLADSAATVRQWVGSIPGAVGFLRVSDVTDSVKVVSVDGVAAGAADYRIKVGK